jgi:hypothetical protein
LVFQVDWHARGIKNGFLTMSYTVFYDGASNGRHCRAQCFQTGGDDMKSARLFTTADVVKINQRMINREPAPLAPDIRDRFLRDVRFSREQINSAFAAARRRLGEA